MTSMNITQAKAQAKTKNMRNYSKFKKVDLKKLLKLLNDYPNIPEEYKKQPKKEKKKTITLTDTDINKPEIIDIFYNRYTTAENDKLNKLREPIIAKIINDDKYYKIFKDTPFYKKYTTLEKNLNRELASYPTKKYNSIEVEVKAGRGHNHDFLVKYKNRKGEIIEEIIAEFKYGATTVTECPQFYSKDTKGASIFNDKDYIKYFFEHIDDFIDTFPDNVAKELRKNKPENLTAYRKMVNDMTYKNLRNNKSLTKRYF